LLAAATARFTAQPPTLVVEESGERIELWDADDFDPWETLQWTTVRVLRYRQHKGDGRVVEAYWLTDFPTVRVGSRLRVPGDRERRDQSIVNAWIGAT
jgi:hypothetical protein